MPTRHALKVAENRHLGLDRYKLRVEWPDTSVEVHSGQFFMVKCGSGNDPFLRRPISLHRMIRRDGGDQSIEMLFDVRGRGTALLARKKPGDVVDLIGPLGNGFRVNQETDRHCIVAGGIGVAPMVALAAELVASAGDPLRVSVVIGARTSDQLLCVWDFRELGISPDIATDDGSEGFEGTAFALAKALLRDSGTACYACGPNAMLASIARMCLERQVPCQVSVESLMGCGVGVCMGCVLPSRSDDGEVVYKRACVEGPVFDADNIYWDHGTMKDVLRVLK